MVQEMMLMCGSSEKHPIYGKRLKMLHGTLLAPMP